MSAPFIFSGDIPGLKFCQVEEKIGRLGEFVIAPVAGSRERGRKSI